MSSIPIADHALLSDRHSSALVTTAGSVDWLSFPRFDSPSVLGRLLGNESMEALWVAACPDEADDFFAFMATAAASGMGPEVGLQVMFGIGGEHDLTERELPHLEGWRNSRPVRVGNGAWNQRQIDVYGEVLGAAHRLADQWGGIDDDSHIGLVNAAWEIAEASRRAGSPSPGA